MKIYNKLEQLSDEWFAVRKGKMTASHAQAIATAGVGLDSYIYEMMADIYSSADKEHYANKDTQRGIDLEPQARSLYELTTGNKVKEVGFIEHNKFSGCSPDGLVGEKGGIEIKCLNDTKHFKMLIRGEKEIPSGYIWQIKMTLYITGREWWDYVGYNPNFKKSLIIYRIFPDRESFRKIRKGLKIGTEKIKEIKKLTIKL